MTQAKSLRCLVLTPDAYAGYGGIAQATRDLLRGVKAMPEIAEAVCLSRAREDFDPAALPAKLRWNVPRGDSLLSLFQALLRLLWRGARFDLILVTHINLLPLAWMARLWRGGRIAVLLHGEEAWKPQRQAVVKPLLGAVDSFLSVSDHTRQRFLQWAPVVPAKVKLHPNCVDLARFTPGPPETGFLARHVLEGKRVLLLVTRLSPLDAPRKGVDEILAVLPKLAERHSDLAFAVAGKGEDRSRIEQRARDLGVAAEVRLLGFVPEADKVALYRSAAAYVMPGRVEGFGLVYLEAMACGIPVLGSRLDASQEVVEAIGFGAAVDPDDPDALVAGIERVLALPAGQRPQGLEPYSREAHAARTAALLRALLGGGD
ncbi:MAG: glycosyltransferase family 4 protein [Rhodovibrionaceae bacterium]